MFRLNSFATKPLVSSFTAAAGSAGVGAMRHYASGSKDFYKTLGISKGADQKEVKKAYRKRAMETHPDQGGNKDEFAEVSQAYEVLSNTEKRQMYDNYGADAAQNMGGPGGMGGMGGRDPSDIFSEFFRQGGMGGGGGGFGDMFGGGMGGGGGGRGPSKVDDQETTVKLTLEEVNSGYSKKIRVQRPETCNTCKGEGTKAGKTKTSCGKCRGSGRVVQQHSMGPGMVQQVVAACPACGGAGSSAAPGDQCTDCSGQGFKNTSANVSINVPKGVHGNNVLVMQGEAGTKPNSVAGDLHIHLDIAKHRVFERKGNDLLVNHDCTLIEALTGVHKKVKLLDGRVIVVQSEKGKILKDNGVIKVPGEGLATQSGGKGDLYVIVKVVMPSSLNEEQVTGLEGILGKPRRETSDNFTNGKVLTESKEALERMKASAWSATAEQGGSQRRGRSSRGGGMGGGGGGQQAECSQQ